MASIDFGVRGARRHRPEAFRRIGADLALRPQLGQGLAREGEIDGAARVALHHRVGAAQRLLGDHPGRQIVFPLGVGPHDARLVERLLHEMHVGVARAQKLAARREGRLAGHQQHRDAGAAEIVQRHRRVGGAGIDMDHHALAAARRDGVARRHVHRGVLVRAEDGRGRRPVGALEGGHGLDQRRVIGAEVAEQIVEADLVQAFEEIVRRRVAGLVAAVHAGHSSLMLAAAATSFQRAVSRAIRSRYSSGVVLRGSTAMASIAFFTSSSTRI